MKIYTTPTHYILNPNCHEITNELAEFLGIAYKSMPKDKHTAFDLGQVSASSSKLFKIFEQISKERTVNLINVNDKMLASLCLMKYDKFVKIYANDIDMFEDKHEVKNRRFTIV